MEVVTSDKMNFFNDDPFEDIVREFFGQEEGREKHPHEIIRGEEDERTIDFIETENKVFLVFEIPGYSKEDIILNVKKAEVEIIVKKKNLENVQDYLSQKLRHGIYFKKHLPNFVNHKKFNWTLKNGILEVSFDKK